MTGNGNGLGTIVEDISKRSSEEQEAVRETMRGITVMLDNALSSRSQILQKITGGDSRRDIDECCGYFDTIEPATYYEYYTRHDVSARVVNVLPNECWKVWPKISETDDAEEETEFEKSLALLNKQLTGDSKFDDRETNVLMSELHRVDRLSGVGDSGLLFFGFGDGQEDFAKPVAVLDEEGQRREGAAEEFPLLYLNVFDRSRFSVKTTEKNPQNRRYGKPTSYEVKFYDSDGNQTDTKIIHWHRCIYVQDNDGMPRMQQVFNRLYDLRKLFGASGEGFWTSVIQKLFFKKQEGYEDVTFDDTAKETLREDLYQFFNTLQRYLNLEGLEAYALPPQLADPMPHFELHVKAICIVIEVPYRIFMGTEEAKLAGQQDTSNWEPRVKRRQVQHCTPNIIVPVIDRLINVGTLAEPESYSVDWPDLSAPTDDAKAKIALTITEALAKWVAGNVGQAVVLADFLSIVFGGLFSDEEIQQMVENAEEQAAADEEEMEARMEEEEEKRRQEGMESHQDGSQRVSQF
jgi:hypothetical protein